MYDAYRDKGLEILDFPCNQFGEQAPGSDEEIQSFCTVCYSTTFPRFSKVDVNDENAIPLYKWLSENSKFEGFGMSPMALAMHGIAKKMDTDYTKNSTVKWNYTKFLISRDGKILARFEPTSSMTTVMEKVKAAL